MARSRSSLDIYPCAKSTLVNKIINIKNENTLNAEQIIEITTS